MHCRSSHYAVMHMRNKKSNIQGRLPKLVSDFPYHKELLLKEIIHPLWEQILSFKRSKVSEGAKIRNRYNQVPHLTQDTNGKVTNSQLDTTNESQEVSPFPASDHKAHINRRAQRHSKHKTEQKYKRSTKEVPPWNSQ